MNNTNAMNLIATGALSTVKMLDLCGRASDNDSKERKELVRMFLKIWKESNHLSGVQDLIDVITQRYSVESIVVSHFTYDWNKGHFEYAFKKLSCTQTLLCVAAASGKYNQEEVFDFSERYSSYGNEGHTASFWGDVVHAGILNAEGLYKIAMLKSEPDSQERIEMQKLCLLIISKNLLRADQLMALCDKYKTDNNVAFAAIATGHLSDDQIVSLVCNNVANYGWLDVISYLHLEDRTVEDMISFGEKANNIKLWDSINAEVKLKIATGHLSDDQIIAVISNQNLRCEWKNAIPYLQLQFRNVEDLIAFGEKVDSDSLWPAIIDAIDRKKV